GREDPDLEVHGSTCCHEPASALARGYFVASSSSVSATSKSSAMSHRSGSNSGHDTMPTSSLPVSDITVMFSPEPWKIGPSGYIALTSLPRKYSGTCGPGTLEIARLCTGFAAVSLLAAYTLMAIPNTAGAANCVQSCSRVAPIAELCCLATEFASAIDLRRSPGSCMCVSSL